MTEDRQGRIDEIYSFRLFARSPMERWPRLFGSPGMNLSQGATFRLGLTHADEAENDGRHAAHCNKLGRNLTVTKPSLREGGVEYHREGKDQARTRVHSTAIWSGDRGKRSSAAHEKLLLFVNALFVAMESSTNEQLETVAGLDRALPTTTKAFPILPKSTKKPSTFADPGVSFLPISRVHRIIKADRDIKICSKEAIFLISKATVRSLILYLAPTRPVYSYTR